MKVYVTGKINMDPIEVRKNLMRGEVNLRQQGHIVMTPRLVIDFSGFEHHDTQKVCFAMIDVCDAIYMLKDWKESIEAREQLDYAKQWHKTIMWEDESTKE